MSMDEMKNYLTPLAKKLKDLEEEGFSIQFKFVENGLEDTATNKVYPKGELKLVKKYRFEGESNPSDMAILYAIEGTDGSKGTLVNAYGTYADEDMDEFLQEVDDKTKDT